MSFQTLAEIDFVARPTVQKELKGLPGLAVVKFPASITNRNAERSIRNGKEFSLQSSDQFDLTMRRFSSSFK